MKFISIFLVLSQLSAVAAKHEQPAVQHSNNKKNEASAKYVTEKFSHMIKEKLNEIQKQYGHEGPKNMREKTLSRIINTTKKAPMSKKAVEENRKLMHGESHDYSLSHYHTTGYGCTGQVMMAEGYMDGQPVGKETLRQSDLNLCEYNDGYYAMHESVKCMEDGDRITEHYKVKTFSDHDCKTPISSYSGEYSYPKCMNSKGGSVDQPTEAIITQCSSNATPMNNFKGLYIFVYPPGTCGKKLSPISYHSILLEDYCYPIDDQVDIINGKFMTGAKYRYNETTNKLDFNVYYQDIPTAKKGLEIVDNLAYNGGDPCGGYMEKFEENYFGDLDNIYECILMDAEYYFYSSLQHVSGDGKVTTRHIAANPNQP